MIQLSLCNQKYVQATPITVFSGYAIEVALNHVHQNNKSRSQEHIAILRERDI